MQAADLLTLAQWMAGEFDNQAQSAAQPAWFVHLRLWYRPLPFQINGQLALFAEQANALFLENAYRQRVVVLQAEPAEAQYFALRQPDRFRGAGAKPERLAELTLDQLDRLPGCRLTITQQGNAFHAHPDPETKCFFQYEGQQRQVVLGLEVSFGKLLSFDRGVDPDTGASLWGAIMGPYEFRKVQDFSQQLPV